MSNQQPREGFGGEVVVGGGACPHGTVRQAQAKAGWFANMTTMGGCAHAQCVSAPLHRRASCIGAWGRRPLPAPPARLAARGHARLLPWHCRLVPRASLPQGCQQASSPHGNDDMLNGTPMSKHLEPTINHRRPPATPPACPCTRSPGPETRSVAAPGAALPIRTASTCLSRPSCATGGSQQRVPSLAVIHNPLHDLPSTCLCPALPQHPPRPTEQLTK